MPAVTVYDPQPLAPLLGGASGLGLSGLHGTGFSRIHTDGVRFLDLEQLVYGAYLRYSFDHLLWL